MKSSSLLVILIPALLVIHSIPAFPQTKETDKGKKSVKSVNDTTVNYSQRDKQIMSNIFDRYRKNDSVSNATADTTRRKWKNLSRSTDSTRNKTNASRQSERDSQIMSKILDRYKKKDSTEIRKETKPDKP